MKQKLIQKQNKKETINQQIEKKTKQLVKNLILFKTIEKKFTRASMKLVKDLIDLHRIKNKEYSFCDLVQEDEFLDYSDVLEKYIPYDISPVISKLYHEGKLDNVDLMVLANTDKEFQEPRLQNKIVEKILLKEIKSIELIRASKNDIREMIGEEVNRMEEDRALIIEVVYQMKHAVKIIKTNKKRLLEILEKKHKDKLKENFNHLKNAIRFGLKIKV